MTVQCLCVTDLTMTGIAMSSQESCSPFLAIVKSMKTRHVASSGSFQEQDSKYCSLPLSLGGYGWRRGLHQVHDGQRQAKAKAKRARCPFHKVARSTPSTSTLDFDFFPRSLPLRAGVWYNTWQ